MPRKYVPYQGLENCIGIKSPLSSSSCTGVKKRILWLKGAPDFNMGAKMVDRK